MDKGIRAGEEALLSAALESVQELNERCLLLLQMLAREQQGRLPHFLDPLRSRLRELDACAISRIGRQPFLLVDFAFGRPKVLRELLVRGPAPLRFPGPLGTLPEPEAAALIRGALILAKSVCRYHPGHAGLLLGLDPSLQTSIVELRLPDAERLAEEHPHALRLRWENRTDVWRYLLSVDALADPGALHQVRMYCMQLIAGDLYNKV